MDPEKIRNFCIISHIDHGKSTLADRLLEMTGTISAGKMHPQFLDRMELEKEKGITIKLKPVRMNYSLDDVKYILNLIDTPGHVDFGYEVSRSLAAVEGVILLVDATQGIQAQTLANLDLAKNQNLTIIPVINKIDLPQASVDESIQELAGLLEIEKEKIIKISAKQGTNIGTVLKEVVEKIPSPKSENVKKPFRALIFDSQYHPYKGVIAFIRVVDGQIKSNQKIKLIFTNVQAEAKEIGYFTPDFLEQNNLSAGEIGYIATGIKEPGKVRVGDTITEVIEGKIEPLAGYKEPKPMVFVSLYPENPDDYELFRDALAKLKLQDPSLTTEPETKEFLGRGFRCGFLGTLHAEILAERLLREFNLRLIISSPSVLFKIIDTQGGEHLIYSASDWPEVQKIKEAKEPWVDLQVITPVKYIGGISDVLKNLQAQYQDTKYLSQDRVVLEYFLPLRAIIVSLYDKIKNISQGYGSMNYKVQDFRAADLAKLEIFIAGRREEAFSKIIQKDQAYDEGKKIVEKLKETLPPQMFSVALQAVMEGRVIARETIKARRKDVTGYLYGGDYTRKRKLLEKQKKGKKKLKERGNLAIPPKVFLDVFRGE